MTDRDKKEFRTRMDALAEEQRAADSEIDRAGCISEGVNFVTPTSNKTINNGSSLIVANETSTEAGISE